MRRWTRTFLRPVAYLAGRHAMRQVRGFLAAHQRTADVQDRLLAQMLRDHAETDFGRDHGFASIGNYDDFRRAVPIRTYEALQPYIDRVLAGQTTALLPAGEQLEMFSRTSGTTGEPKHIPVTRRFLADLRRGWNIFGVNALTDHPAGWLRAIVTISSSIRETTSPAGTPCGAISGLLSASQKRIVRRMYVAPRGAEDIQDPAAKYYTILRCGVGRDVSMITTANPSSTIKLIETGQAHAERLCRDVADGTFCPPGDVPAELARRVRCGPNPALARQIEAGIARDGELRPGHFWNVEVLCNWTGGTVGLYLPRLRELFGPVPIRDIGLVASEGRLSIPLEDETPAGVAEITANVLEFVPADQADRLDPTTRRAHELDVGAEYSIVLSNRAGLWRYHLDDRVRVTGHLGTSPVFEFLSRGAHTANITGEKITEHQVVAAMAHAARQTGTALDRFTLQGRFARVPYYQLRVELPAGPPAQALANALDRALGELNIEYRAKRDSQRLGPVRAVSVEPGTFLQREQDILRRRHGRGEQYKHTYLLTNVLK